jgi:hypothetical protein
MDTKGLRDYLAEKRGSLSESSVKTYASILRSLQKKLTGNTDVEGSSFNDTKKVLAALADVEPSKRKTTLSALVIMTDKQQYRDAMMKDIKSYKDQISKREKTEKQEANWVTEDDIHAKYEELNKDVAHLWKKENLTSAEHQRLQNFVIVAVLGGVHIPVRRSKDYVDFKIGNVDTDKDNYFDKKNNMVFNSYKTAKHYGQQKIDVPRKLKAILKKWVAKNPTDWLLFDSKYNGLGGQSGKSASGSVKLNQRLEKIFNKKVGVNGLRHSSLSENFSEVLTKAVELTEDMGTSLAQLETYAKK